ncbi:MAG: hypothetical protein NTV54_14990 [Ignavibacteriales bacterium]|nr:hypothetical protein [Ignavibacteriales bacterium]
MKYASIKFAPMLTALGVADPAFAGDPAKITILYENTTFTPNSISFGVSPVL